MQEKSKESLLADSSAPICTIPSQEAFDGLTQRQKLYAHHLCRACFNGTRIVFRQTSSEAEGIFDFLVELSDAVDGDWKALFERTGLEEQDLNHFLDYASMFLANVGNYRSTGDTKFIPRLQVDRMSKLSGVTPRARDLFDKIASDMYSTKPCRYGYSTDDFTASGYYPGKFPITEDEVDVIHRFLQKNNILPENTRLSKQTHDDGHNTFNVHIASSEKVWQPIIEDAVLSGLPIGSEVSIKTGDFGDCLDKIVKDLQNAIEYTTGDTTQQRMIEALIAAFQSGDHQRFKEAQTLWVQDRSPVVEVVIGFIETYQDPHGTRGAWEGITAIANLEQSRKFSKLVDKSNEFISSLPWNGTYVGLEDQQLSQFESASFLKPAFTSLDTLGFVKSESPAGLNLPNFEDICQTAGSKDLEFGNVINTNPPKENIPFILGKDIECLRQNREKAFEMMVACHELLGHGSGRLLCETEPGVFNFDIENPPINPLTQKPIESWYKLGETWAGVFGADANAIEECRADGVSLLLLTDRKALEVFGFNDSSEYKADDIMYAGFLTFTYSTLQGLARWNPETKKWGQSHRRGQFALLKCMLECNSTLLQLLEVDGNVQILLERTKIRSHAVPAIANFLQKLQIYKSIANPVEGVSYFNLFADVDERFSRIRDIVLKKELPRIQYVQPNTVLKDGHVYLVQYPATREGLIQSWVERNI